MSGNSIDYTYFNGSLNQSEEARLAEKTNKVRKIFLEPVRDLKKRIE